MLDKVARRLAESLARLSTLNASVAERSARWTADSIAGAAKLAQLNSYLYERWIDGGFSPLMRSLIEVERDIAAPMLDCLLGDREIGDCIGEIGKRTTSGARYRKLVHTLGAQLFGSARFDGEEVIAESDLFTLSYLPPSPGAPPTATALFHLGGFIPYGDRIFRFLPEANLFLPFLKRGIPVYAMEVKPRPGSGRVQRVTLEELIDTIAALGAAAHTHHARGKLLIEGYCGLGLPMLAYLAARPEHADARFSTALLMAAPVDARACTLIGEMLQSLPEPLLSTRLTLPSLFGGTALRLAIDLPVNTLFYKSRTGQFLTGWKRRDYAEVVRVDQLTPEQRLELAGAYWISPKTFSRHPIPAELLRLFTRLWQEGIDDDLALPASYRGTPLTLRTIAERTSIRVAGFFGGEDRLIPEQTGAVLARGLGERYTHVVHPKAGHVSYIVVPAMWNPKLPFAFRPNPIDVALQLHAGA